MKENSNLNTFDQYQQLLKLFESQLDGTRQEILDRTDSLSASFEALFESVNELQILQANDQDISSESLGEKCADMSNALVACVSSLQFTDAVCQRIEHLSSGLQSVRKSMEKDDLNSSVAWGVLINEIRQAYSVKQEHEIFDNIIHGYASSSDDSSEDLFNG